MPEAVMTETLAIDAAANLRRTRDGYLLAAPRVARTGIQLYAGDEVGMPDRPIVRMMRPKEVVFAADSLASYANKPVTMDHPGEFVSAENWRDHAVGQTGGEVLRDGDYVRVPLMLTDKTAIDAVESGERVELSLGYHMNFEAEAGDGHDARVTGIRANHLAIVDRARGGPALNITGDEDMPTAQTFQVTLDGMTVNVADAGSLQIVQRHAKDVEDKIAKAVEKITTLEAERATMAKAADEAKAKIAALEKAAEDAKLSPEKLDAMIAEAGKVKAVAKAVLGDAGIGGKSPAALKRAVVDARMGDTAKGYDDAQVATAYQVLAKGVEEAGRTVPPSQDFSALLSGASRTRNTDDARTKAYADYVAWLEAGDASAPIGGEKKGA